MGWGGWRKSSQCQTYNCVEVEVTDKVVNVRDSKSPKFMFLSFTHVEWANFIAGVKNDEFNIAAGIQSVPLSEKDV